MNFRITLIYLQKITIGLLFLITLSCEIQADEVKPGTYMDLTKALQNPLNVRVLDLSGQNFTTLPKEIEQLKNLQELDLRDNQLATFPAVIVELQKLESLDLSENRLVMLPNEIGR
ncbi:leucine-rich repeat domain-containing protein, partial [Leptospira interrogans]